MTPKQQRIAIAEACGWKNLVQVDDDDLFGCHPSWTKEALSHRLKTYVSEDFSGHLVPDYPNNLNAMHEAEKILNPHDHASFDCQPCKWIEFTLQLVDVCKREKTVCIHATALQRAESLLKTLGLWKD